MGFGVKKKRIKEGKRTEERKQGKERKEKKRKEKKRKEELGGNKIQESLGGDFWWGHKLE